MATYRRDAFCESQVQGNLEVRQVKRPGQVPVVRIAGQASVADDNSEYSSPPADLTVESVSYIYPTDY